MAECSEPEQGPGEGSSEDAALAGADLSAGVIAFAALEFYPATAGGTGILLHHTVASLLRRGYEVLLPVAIHEAQRGLLPDAIDLMALHVDEQQHLVAAAEEAGDGVMQENTRPARRR
ncbi:MAG: hypothetical protein AAFR84_18275, partial [Pseudomonadota bacterium]